MFRFATEVFPAKKGVLFFSPREIKKPPRVPQF